MSSEAYARAARQERRTPGADIPRLGQEFSLAQLAGASSSRR